MTHSSIGGTNFRAEFLPTKRGGPAHTANSGGAGNVSTDSVAARSLSSRKPSYTATAAVPECGLVQYIRHHTPQAHDFQQAKKKKRFRNYYGTSKYDILLPVLPYSHPPCSMIWISFGAHKTLMLYHTHDPHHLSRSCLPDGMILRQLLPTSSPCGMLSRQLLRTTS